MLIQRKIPTERKFRNVLMISDGLTIFKSTYAMLFEMLVNVKKNTEQFDVKVNDKAFRSRL